MTSEEIEAFRVMAGWWRHEALQKELSHHIRGDEPAKPAQ